MDFNRALFRQLLDRRLAASQVLEQIGPPPREGWIREIRTALGMSSYSLASRARMSPTRVRELEKAEIDGTIRLRQLNRVAAGFNCAVFYALLPNQSLDDMVWRQAYLKAVQELGAVGLGHRDHQHPDRPLPEELARRARLDELAVHFVDHQKLWSSGPEDPGPTATPDLDTDHSEPHRR